MKSYAVRLKNFDEIKFIADLLNQKTSEVIRSLVKEGRKMKAVELYKRKKVSLGLGARIAGLVLTEFIDLLEEYNIPLNLTKEDAEKSLEHAKKYL